MGDAIELLSARRDNATEKCGATTRLGQGCIGRIGLIISVSYPVFAKPLEVAIP